MSTDTATHAFERSFTLSPDQLWHLITDAKMREKWGGPGEGMVLTMVKEDLSVGGYERHRCGTAEAPEFEVSTRWYRITAPNDAVFTETVHAGGEDIATSLVTYRVEPKESGTTLHVTVATSSFCGPEALADFEAGWTAGLANLTALAENVVVS